MPLPEMYADDKRELHALLGIPLTMLEIPDNVRQLYARVQRAQTLMGHRGGMSSENLMAICIACDVLPEVPEPRPAKYVDVPEGTQMWFRVDKFHSEPCTFLRVADALTYTYQVRLFNEIRQVDESRLTLDNPNKIVVPIVAAAPEDLVDEDDDEDVSNVTPAAEAPVHVAARLTDLFPKGEQVEVCVPGTPEWFGTVQGHGGGRMTGRLQVIPDIPGDKAYQWVPATHVYRVRDFVGAPTV